MATSVEDKEKNATTSQVRFFFRIGIGAFSILLKNYSYVNLFQIEEKTFTHTTSTTANRTEETVVTQEMRATATHVLTTGAPEDLVSF